MEEKNNEQDVSKQENKPEGQESLLDYDKIWIEFKNGFLPSLLRMFGRQQSGKRVKIRAELILGFFNNIAFYYCLQSMGVEASNIHKQCKIFLHTILELDKDNNVTFPFETMLGNKQ